MPEVLHLVACSDVHIGSYGSAMSKDGMNEGFLSNRRVRQFMLDWMKVNKPDVGFFVGDLYKSAIGRPTQTEQYEAAQWFRDWSLLCPVYAKRGNHDEGEAHGVSALEVFDLMNLRMTVLPEKSAEWSLVTVDGVRIAMYHGMLSGAMLESGMTSDSLREGLLGIRDAPSAHVYLLGDVHHRQFLAPNAAYCGALDRLNFGEEDETPSFWSIKVSEDGKIVWEAITTPARVFRTLTDESDVLFAADTALVKGAVVRFIGELETMTHSEMIARLKEAGALEVASISDTSELDASPSMFASFDPPAAFSVWLDAQEGISASDKAFAAKLLPEVLS